MKNIPLNVSRVTVGIIFSFRSISIDEGSKSNPVDELGKYSTTKRNQTRHPLDPTTQQ